MNAHSLNSKTYPKTASIKENHSNTEQYQIDSGNEKQLKEFSILEPNFKIYQKKICVYIHFRDKVECEIVFKYIKLP